MRKRHIKKQIVKNNLPCKYKMFKLKRSKWLRLLKVQKQIMKYSKPENLIKRHKKHLKDETIRLFEMGYISSIDFDKISLNTEIREPV